MQKGLRRLRIAWNLRSLCVCCEVLLPAAAEYTGKLLLSCYVCAKKRSCRAASVNYPAIRWCHPSHDIVIVVLNVFFSSSCMLGCTAGSSIASSSSETTTDRALLAATTNLKQCVSLSVMRCTVTVAQRIRCYVQFSSVLCGHAQCICVHAAMQC